MKDYTGYDFAAIVGVEVSILLKSKIEYRGTLKLISNKAILLLMNDNPLALEGRWFAIEDIVPGSLTAKIKVEDMTVKQLEKAFDIGLYDAITINREEGILEVCINDCGEINESRIKKSLADYIDCTDWGWRK